MTTIELEFTNMSNQVGQPSQGVKATVRIVSQDSGGGGLKSDSGGESSRQSPRPLVRKRITGFDLNKDFACYRPNMFTITAYLPNEEMEGEKRLKV